MHGGGIDLTRGDQPFEAGLVAVPSAFSRGGPLRAWDVTAFGCVSGRVRYPLQSAGVFRIGAGGLKSGPIFCRPPFDGLVAIRLYDAINSGSP